jgi:hypothetical protein
MKTIETNSNVDGFIDTIEDESKRQDCRALTQLMAAATGVEPRVRPSFKVVRDLPA